MQPMDEAYTARTIEERDRVENQLDRGYYRSKVGVKFEYQGSITNDTHIRVYSDVDLLTVEQRWHGLQPPLVPQAPYPGDPIEDLRELRFTAASTLRSAFPEATVDESGGKCINISGGSLKRKVDVIACAWWHSVDYVQQGHDYLRGIEILDHEKGTRVSNKPFLHNKKIEERDAETSGGLRKVIRLLKSLKYDDDSGMEISSYDIAGIAHSMPTQWLTVTSGYDLQLVSNTQSFLRYLLEHPDYRSSLEVPNKTRKLFAGDGATETGLKELSVALDSLVSELDGELNRTHRKLKESRISY
jgi:hypothetical protein